MSTPSCLSTPTMLFTTDGAATLVVGIHDAAVSAFSLAHDISRAACRSDRNVDDSAFVVSNPMTIEVDYDGKENKIVSDQMVVVVERNTQGAPSSSVASKSSSSTSHRRRQHRKDPGYRIPPVILEKKRRRKRLRYAKEQWEF